jgi:hypothetical protein
MSEPPKFRWAGEGEAGCGDCDLYDYQHCMTYNVRVDPRNTCDEYCPEGAGGG